MLAVLAIIHLVIAARDTAKLVHQGERLDHFADGTGNGNRIVGMRLGQVQHLNALVFRLIPIGHHYPL
jgi:hypothetical protein